MAAWAFAGLPQMVKMLRKGLNRLARVITALKSALQRQGVPLGISKWYTCDVRLESVRLELIEFDFI